MPSTKKVHIVTLLLDDASQHFFEQQRQQYYPKHCNVVPAHITVLHTIPSDNTFVTETITAIAQAQHLFTININKVVAFKNGNAYAVKSNKLLALQLKLVTDLHSFLHNKDVQLYQPHITIQQKVTAYKATITHKKLTETFTAFNATALGLCIWKYSKQQWQLVNTLFFNQHLN